MKKGHHTFRTDINKIEDRKTIGNLNENKS